MRNSSVTIIFDNAQGRGGSDRQRGSGAGSACTGAAIRVHLHPGEADQGPQAYHQLCARSVIPQKRKCSPVMREAWGQCSHALAGKGGL